MRLHRAQTAKRAKRVLFSVSQEESSCGDASDSDSTDWSSHSDGCQLEDDVSDCDAYGEATNGYRTLDPNDPVIIAEVKRRATERLEGVAAAVCCVCDRIIHTLKVKEFDAARYKPRRQELKADQVADKLRSLVSEPGQNELCGTCYSHITKGNTPTMARVNGFKYPEVPADLPPLTEVAEHILAPRIPFQQITNLGRMGRRGQFGIRGSIINIPTAPKDTVEQVIPLMPGADEVYVVNLKRKRVHKRPYASSYVGKEMLTKWGTYLQETELYQKYQVTFDPVRVWEVPEASEDPTDPENQEFDGQAQYSILMTDALAVNRPRPADTTEDITIAPGEHQQPISVVTDRECEELSFPSVYLGEARNFTVPVSRYVAMKSEVRRRDRRGAKPRPVLYKWAVHAREQVARRLRHRFRRGAAKHLGKAVTKSMLDDPTFTASSQRQGLAIPNLMPNSAQYWKAIGHDVFAMVRQLSKPHLFFTISAAEHKWPILLRTLQRLSKTPGQVEQHAAGPGGQEAMDTGAEVPAADPSGIPSDERLKLVREDPVVCAMYFREVVEEVRRCLRMDRGRGPMGQYPVRDYLFRIEFQSRGSPHLHCLLWLDNAPEDPLADPEAAARFIDSLISCSASAPNAEVNRHKHTATCFRNKTVLRRFWKKELTEQDMHRHCRFGAPFWPSPRTRILLPLYHKDANEQFLAGGKSWREHLQELRERAPDRRRPRQPQPQPQQEDTWEDYLAEVRSLRHRLKDVLVSETCPETVEELWQQAGCPDEESYLVAIRSGMLRPMVLYRREMADRWTNSYLPWVLEVFGSNTDAQLILDVYSLVRYCVGYITKGEKTHSELHRHMLRLRRERGYDDRELLYKISSEALRSKETSAQEAAWILLQFPLSEKSRQCRFIDTSVPDERKRSPKTGKEWQDLAQDSSDIWRPDVFDEYARRPEHLEGVSLAAYVASYLNSTRKKDAEGHVQPRGRDWVIRWRKFNPKSEKSTEREDFYRSMCTLHMPWREEAEEILRPGEASTFEALYQRHEEVILRGRRRFEADLELEQDLDLEKAQCVAEDEAENCELDDLVRRYVAGTSKYVFEEEEEAEYMDGPGQDIRVDVPGAAPAAARVVAEARQRAQWDRETLHRVIRTLNKRQRDVVLSVIDGIRSRSAPRLLYIDGTAGVGKSLVARCLANAFEMFAPNNIPGYPKCFVSAPTGKAADNVEGMTIHSLYVLPFNQQSKRKQSAEEDTRLAPLNPETLAKLQNRFSDAYGQLIDEVSMLSQLQLVLIDLRCKEATGRQDVPFGGLWTIVIGDFRQLKPVGGQSLLDVSTSSLAGALPLWNQFEYVELTENMRQGEDKDFANVLRKIGDYEQLTDEERRLIESRCVRLNKLQVPDSATRLYKLNADVDRYNTEQLMANPAEKIIVIEARDRVEQKGNYMHSVPASTRRRLEEHGDKYLERALQLNTQQAAGLPASLVAVVGFPYLLTRNIDTADGLVNGAVGELVWVEFGRLRRPHQTADGAEEEVAVRRLWMRFPGHTGRARSAANRQQLRDAIAVSQQYAEHAWPYDMPPPPTEAELEGLVPFEREDLKLESIKTEDWRQVKRQQFPLVPALAMTIHKVQGSTKDYVLVLYDPSYTNPLVYVALSRVTKLEGLFIDDAELLPDEEGRLFQHPPRLSACGAKVLTAKEKRDMESLRAERDRFLADKERLRGRQLVPRWHALQDPDNSLYERRVLYHNVQGLAVHLEDIQRDEVYMSAEVLLLAETHLKPQDQVELGEGWRLAARCDWISGINRGGGVAIYSRVPCEEVRCPRKQDMEAAMVQFSPTLRLAVMYCHGKPKAADVVEYVRALLASAPPGVSTLLAGDFNINMCHPAAGQGAQLTEGLAALGLGMLNDNKVHTTYWDQGGATVIDAVFSDVAAPVLQVETYQSYFSYHLPLVVSMEYV